MPYLRCRSWPYSRTCVCARASVQVRRVFTRTSVYTRDRAGRRSERGSTTRDGPPTWPFEFVFGGLRIVWISNDCAEPVRACDDACLRTRRDFPGQVTYRRFTTRCLVSFFFLSLSLSPLFLSTGYHSAPFWKDAVSSRTSCVRGYYTASCA